MLSSTLLASFGFFGGDIGNFLLQLEQLGFFSFVLPFLIVFSLVFGILSRINIFEDNKAVNGIISLSVGLMALQFGFVSNFFSEIFPRLGVGLAIILVVLIFLGLFMDPDEKWMNNIMLAIGALIVIFILIDSAAFSGSPLGFWVSNNFGAIFLGIFIIGILAAVFAGVGKKPKRTGDTILEKALRGGK